MNRAIDSKYRNTMVCIDSYQNKVLCGRMYNPFHEGAVNFRSTMEFVRAMEELLDTMNFPQACELKRSFFEREEGDIIESDFPKQVGKKATFEVKIFFRQNVSWQGTVCWLDAGREESFRSALELFLLIDSALQV
ncbi:hypothetical protein SAMN02910358_01762 [Lachnospiraceae bacterium XBB1006]|nr:hypothetical protein SAMN02910358_01762 [Lachnospiraceae bacterium XBB1006]